MGCAGSTTCRWANLWDELRILTIRWCSFSKELVPLNLDRLQSWVDQGRIDASRPITIRELGQSRCVCNIRDGVKLLSRGFEQLRSPLNVVVSQASAGAIAAIEKAGGSVMTRFYTPFAIKRILRGRTDPVISLKSPRAEGQAFLKTGFMPRLPDPTSRKDIEYYRDPVHRGYLSYQIAEGQGPSLFFKTPGTGTVGKRKTKGKRAQAGENKLF